MTILNLMRMAKGSYKRAKNNVEKQDTACYDQFLLFPQCIFRGLVLQTCKNQGLFGKGFIPEIKCFQE